MSYFKFGKMLEIQKALLNVIILGLRETDNVIGNDNFKQWMKNENTDCDRIKQFRLYVFLKSDSDSLSMSIVLTFIVRNILAKIFVIWTEL